MPVWRKHWCSGRCDRWETLLCKHDLLGVISVHVVWDGNLEHGTAYLYRNDAFQCELSLVSAEDIKTLDALRDAAWKAGLDYLYGTSIFIQTYLTRAREMEPGVQS